MPPLAAIPPEELPKPTSLANHLHKSFSILEIPGESSSAKRLLFKAPATRSPTIEIVKGGGSK